MQRELKLQLKSEISGRFSIIKHMLEKLYVHRYRQISGHEQTQFTKRILEYRIQLVVVVGVVFVYVNIKVLIVRNQLEVALGPILFIVDIPN